MLQFLIAGLLSVGGVQVEVKPLSGDLAKGEIIGLSNDTLLLRTAAGDQMLKVSNLELAKPEVLPPAPIGKTTIRVNLVDGSKLLGSNFAVDQGRATIDIDGASIPIDTRSIHSVLLKSHETHPGLIARWSEMKKTKGTGDAIVIRKEVKVPIEDDPDDGFKTELVLNSLEGVLRDISAEEVDFQYDGDLIPVKRTRVEGLIYRAVERVLRDPICRIIDVNGCEWFLKSMDLKDETSLEVATTAGVRATLDVRRITAIDFTAGNTVYLSEVEPDRIDWKPFFDTGALSGSLAKLHRPRMNRSFSGEKLTVSKENGVASFEKGIAIHSQTRLEYLLPGKFNRFVATAGIDPAVRPQGNVRLVITGDRKPLFEGIMTGEDPSPVELNLDLTGVERLAILVDFGDGLDIADHLNLCNARITK